MLTKGVGPKRDFVWAWSIAGAVLCFLFASYLAASPQNAPAKQKVALRSSRPDMVFVQTSVLVPGSLAQRFPNGSRIVRLSRWAANGKPIPLTDGFFAAADPQINFEATKVLLPSSSSTPRPLPLVLHDLRVGQ